MLLLLLFSLQHHLITIFDAAHDPAFIIIVIHCDAMIDRLQNSNYHHT